MRKKKWVLFEIIPILPNDIVLVGNINIKTMFLRLGVGYVG